MKSYERDVRQAIIKMLDEQNCVLISWERGSKHPYAYIKLPNGEYMKGFYSSTPNVRTKFNTTVSTIKRKILEKS